jgi:hypothetical protein
VEPQHIEGYFEERQHTNTPDHRISNLQQDRSSARLTDVISLTIMISVTGKLGINVAGDLTNFDKGMNRRIAGDQDS